MFQWPARHCLSSPMMRLGFGWKNKTDLNIQDNFSDIQHKKLVMVVLEVVLVLVSFPAKYQGSTNKGSIM